ncbi:hypothetical protein, partial [Elioraea rosea]|uniref:hypothetical protein n=1 Tax=Elioraea rosea TaxID=2492390 RepID=UPI00195208F1
ALGAAVAAAAPPVALAAQAALALLAARRAWLSARGLPVPRMRSLSQTAGTLVRLLRLRAPEGGWLAAGQGDLVNLFMLAAAALTLAHAVSPPASAPLAAFAVPAVALGLRALAEGFPRGGGSLEGAALAAALAGGALVLALRGGPPSWCLLALWFALFPALAWRRRA